MWLPWQRHTCRSKYGCFCSSPQVTYLHTENEGGLKFFISNFASLSWRIALNYVATLTNGPEYETMVLEQITWREICDILALMSSATRYLQNRKGSKLCELSSFEPRSSLDVDIVWYLSNVGEFIVSGEIFSSIFFSISVNSKVKECGSFP